MYFKPSERSIPPNLNAGMHIQPHVVYNYLQYTDSIGKKELAAELGTKQQKILDVPAIKNLAACAVSNKAANNARKQPVEELMSNVSMSKHNN